MSTPNWDRLWRSAGIQFVAFFVISCAIYGHLPGVNASAVILGVLGGTTWMSAGFWAPDGAYSRFIWPAIGLVWVLIVSRVLLSRSPATRAGW